MANNKLKKRSIKQERLRDRQSERSCNRTSDLKKIGKNVNKTEIDHIFVVINYQSFYFDTTMTRLVVKTVKIRALKICAPKFLKNGVCFVLF